MDCLYHQSVQRRNISMLSAFCLPLKAIFSHQRSHPALYCNLTRCSASLSTPARPLGTQLQFVKSSFIGASSISPRVFENQSLPSDIIGKSRCMSMSVAQQPSNMLKVGFVGLGIMGVPMVKNLVNKAGQHVVVWNRSNTKSQDLAEEFDTKVSVAATPADVVKQCDITFVMLSTPDAVQSVLLDMPNAAIHGASQGKYIVDCSTISEADSKRSYYAFKKAGALFLEAPVSGSKLPAEQGTLIFLTGGDREVYDQLESHKLLAAMGKKSLFLGAIGAGARMKIAVNMVMGSMLVAMAEAIVLCENNDLKASDLLEVLDNGAMANPMFKLKGPKMAESSRVYDPHFPLEHAQKDMRFALMMGDQSERPTSLPVAAAANELYKAARASGHARDDFSAVIEALRDHSDKKL